MDEKKQFLQDFKKTVKGEGGNLSNGYILERIRRGDISESDLAGFKRYIPLPLGTAIDRIMGVRKTAGILKAAKDIYTKRRLRDNSDVIQMIKQMEITQDDIQKIPKFMEDQAIKKELSKQIDSFFKEVLKYPSMSKEEQHKQKFKIEKLLRKKVVTLNFLERKANVNDIVKSIFGEEYKRYLTEEPYEKEIKEVIDEGFINESNIDYLPEEYIDYYLKNIPKEDKISFKRRRKGSKTPLREGLTKKEVEELTKEILEKPQYKKIKTSVLTPKDISMFSDEDLLKTIKDLESKEDVSMVTKKLEDLNMMTKSKRTKQKGTLQKLRDKYTKEIKKQIEKDEEFLGLVKAEPVTKSLYSVERKIEDLKKGKKSKYLSRAEKYTLAQDLSKRLNEVTRQGQGMKIDKPVASPVSSRSSSRSSSISSSGSLFTSKRKRSAGSSISSGRRSSVGSNSSGVSFKPEKEIKPKEIPELIKLSSAELSELDPDSVRVLSTFVNKSIAYSAGKKQKKDKSRLPANIDKKSLMDYITQEKQIWEKYIKNKKRKTSKSPPLSPLPSSYIKDILEYKTT